MRAADSAVATTSRCGNTRQAPTRCWRGCPAGYDVFTKTFAVDEGAGVTSVYFDRVQCSTGKSHVYKITVS